MASNYRYTSADPDEDERRPDPVGTLGQMVAASMQGLQQIPGVKGASDFFGGIMRGAQQFVQNVPKENALLGALDVVSRPNYAVASAVDQVVKGKGASGLLEGLGAGFTGQTKTSFSDVLETAGVGEGPRLEVGPLNVSARDVAGFGLDVATDPTTYLTFGAAGAAKAGAVKAGKWGATTIAPPLSKTRLTIAPFDPLTATVRAFDVATSALPGGDAAKQVLRTTAGQLFESNYGLKGAGYRQVAEDLQRLRRAPNVYKEEAVETMTRRFAPLDEQQRELFFKAADTGYDMADFIGPSPRGAATGDEAVDTLLRWYRGEYQPWLQGIKQEMGLTSFLDNYIRHVFPEKLKPKGTAVGRPMQKRDPGSFKQRKGAEGYSEDPVLALAYDYAETMIRKETNDFIQNTLARYGRKLKPGETLPEGMVEYFPKGRFGFYKAEALNVAGKRRLGEFISGAGVRAGEAPAEAASRAASAAPATVAAGDGSSLTRAFSVTEPGRQYEFDVRVVPIDQLIPSQLDSFAPNPAFPAELQPRLRERLASQAQVERIASRLNPDELLMDSHRLDTGPMIVGQDMAVESGNGRVLALRKVRAESPEKWADYQARMRAAAERYGLDPGSLPKDGVLVRVRRSDVDRLAFVDEANTAPIMSMSPFEVALRDARRMPEGLPTALTIGENQTLRGALLSTSNRDVVQGFLRSLHPNEIAGISTGAGTLNALGLQRLSDALLALTYRGDAGRRLSEAFVENLESIKNIETAVYQSLPDMAKAEAMARAGQVSPELSIAEDLGQAVNVFARLKQQGESVGDYLSQAALFDRELTPLQEKLLGQLDALSRSPAQLRDYLREYARRVQAAPSPNQASLFSAEEITKESLLDSLGKGLPEPAPSSGAGKAKAAAEPKVVHQDGKEESIDDYLRTVVGVKREVRYAVPEPIGDALNKLGNPREQLLFFKALDAVQGIWKASVTTIWPAFHMRNAMGNVFLNAQAGVLDPAVYKDAAKVQRLGDKAATMAISADGRLVQAGTAGATAVPDFLREAKLQGALSAGYYGEDVPELLAAAGRAGSFTERAMQAVTGPGPALSKVAGKLGADEKLQAKLTKINMQFAGRLAGNLIEDNARLAHILGRMRKGDSFGDAVKSTKRYLFDYGDLSDTERQIRGVVPFYTWTRNNLPLQLEKLAREPRQAAFVSKAAEMLGQDAALTDEERALMPDYVLERFGIVVGRDEQGNPKILNGIGLPIEDLQQFWSLTPERTRNRWLGMATPMLKTPLEYMFDYSTFSGRHISDESYQNLYRQSYPFIAQVPGLRDWLGMTERKVVTKDGERTYYNVDPFKMYLLTSIMGRFYYTAGKATDPRKEMADQLLNNLTGLKIGSVDVKRAASAQLRPEYTMATERIYAERNDGLERAALATLKMAGTVDEPLARQGYRQTRAKLFEDARNRIDAEQAKDMAKQQATTPEKAAALRRLMDPLERALQDYYAITPEAVLDQYGQPDFKAFYRARDEFMEGLDPQTRAAVRAKQLEYINKLPPNAARMEREYQAALDSYREYMKIQPFAVRVGEDDLEVMRDLNRRYMAQPDERARTRFMLGLPGRDKLLLQRYFTIRTRPSVQRQRFEKQHPELQRWGLVR